MTQNRRPLAFFALFFVWSHLISHDLHAEEYVLYREGSPAVDDKKYIKISGKLKPGDVVIFSDREVVLGEFLGAGNLKQTWRNKDSPGRVIQFPVISKFSKTLKNASFYISMAIEEGYKTLAGMPEITPEFFGSARGEWIEVEELEILGYYPTLSKMHWDEFIEFARKISLVTHAFDFRGKNIAYTTKGWRYLDVGRVSLVRSREDLARLLEFHLDNSKEKAHGLERDHLIHSTPFLYLWGKFSNFNERYLIHGWQLDPARMKLLEAIQEDRQRLYEAMTHEMHREIESTASTKACDHLLTDKGFQARLDYMKSLRER
ncbi:MAG: hypothetical protein AB1540_00375 [Bdellovibrionota bacterium]